MTNDLITNFSIKSFKKYQKQIFQYFLRGKRFLGKKQLFGAKSMTLKLEGIKEFV